MGERPVGARHSQRTCELAPECFARHQQRGGGHEGGPREQGEANCQQIAPPDGTRLFHAVGAVHRRDQRAGAGGDHHERAEPAEGQQPRLLRAHHLHDLVAQLTAQVRRRLTEERGDPLGRILHGKHRRHEGRKRRHEDREGKERQKEAEGELVQLVPRRPRRHLLHESEW